MCSNIYICLGLHSFQNHPLFIIPVGQHSHSRRKLGQSPIFMVVETKSQKVNDFPKSHIKWGHQDLKAGSSDTRWSLYSWPIAQLLDAGGLQWNRHIYAGTTTVTAASQPLFLPSLLINAINLAHTAITSTSISTTASWVASLPPPLLPSNSRSTQLATAVGASFLKHQSLRSQICLHLQITCTYCCYHINYVCKIYTELKKT